MKNVKKDTFIVLLITLVVLFFLLKDDYQTIFQQLFLANKWFILMGILLVVLYWALKAVCLYTIVKEYNKKARFKTMFEQIVITQFFNGITPFSTGGQPMQIYMLRKSGIKIASATNIIVQDFIMYQLALVVIGTFALIINGCYHLFDITPTLLNLILLGFVINISIGVVLLFISFSKGFNQWVGRLIIRLGSRFKIVKDQEKTVQKLEEKLAEFHQGARLFKEKKWLFAKCFFYHLLSLFLFYFIPFFVFMSFSPSVPVTVLEVVVSSAFVLIIGNFVPIPGGSGGIEYGFLRIFGSFVSSSILSSSLIVWRFITYYLGIIVGGVALSFFKGDDFE